MERTMRRNQTPMNESWIKELALNFSELTGNPAYFYASNNWLHKAYNGEIKKIGMSKHEKVETNIIIDEVDNFLKKI